ncbi:hypothetical protein RVR_4485 [Actinacidiphila reveromycinica]|uniref:Uncharacterized protein n=1 Tax=Actinacidiphila reveromycinica TaxID=659352 RepID=A0A7U3UT33_9ACTN|nr:hypothetical protein RVR_4485 [Streptomyces sp. SN-593]
MMKLPRVECPKCSREIAAGPVAGRLTKGRLWRHDAPGARRDAEGVLVSCAGSLLIVDWPTPGVQLEIAIETPPEEPADAMALF